MTAVVADCTVATWNLQPCALGDLRPFTAACRLTLARYDQPLLPHSYVLKRWHTVCRFYP